jgi:hypothetical protein
MAASANGWRVIARDECTDVELPGGEVPLHPEFAWLFQDLAIRWHDTVEPLLWPGCWGWAKPTESGRDPSRFVTNHASGTALDLSAPRHPRGVPIAKTFTPAQLEAIARLEARYFGVLRWGGRWTGKDVDGMHWEGIPGVSVDAVRELTHALAAGGAPPPPPPAPTPAPAAPPAPSGPGWTGPDLTGSALALRGDQGNNGARVKALQTFWRTRYSLYAKGLAADGWWGAQTSGVCYQFARRSGITSADGRNIGPQVARQLYLAGFRG